MVNEESLRSAGGVFRPSFQGYVETLREATIICEAYLQGYIICVSRCPSPTEQLNFTRSGHVFVVKNSPGREKWTDGMAWAPRSYTHNGFKVYHESRVESLLPKPSEQLGDPCPLFTPLVEQNRMIKKGLGGFNSRKAGLSSRFLLHRERCRIKKSCNTFPRPISSWYQSTTSASRDICGLSGRAEHFHGR